MQFSYPLTIELDNHNAMACPKGHSDWQACKYIMHVCMYVCIYGTSQNKVNIPVPYS